MIGFSLLSQGWQLKLVGSVALVGILFTAAEERVLAQIVPDNTLGAESSTVTPNVVIRGIPSDQIEGGAIRGANLFHSFEQLSVLEGRGAYFTNPVGIANIFSRVTGANRSEILGRLGVLGNANLFVINPNGIVFGPNASLDVQGSFLATTADALKLGDAGLFSASQPATSNLLTVNPSAFLFNAIAAQPIVNRSQAESLISQPNSNDSLPGLQVQPGRTLALVGGDVLLEEGNLTAAGGRIELGSVAGVGQVSLSQTGNRFVLGYDLVSEFGSILLSNGAFVDASGEGGGDVQIRGARLEMTQDSDIWANTLGTENGGEVLVKTTEAVVLSDRSLLTADVTGTGTGTGGNLTIDTRRLLVRDGARISANTSGASKGGNLLLTASDSVEVVGTSADGQFFISGLFTDTSGSGAAGNLRIDTRHLLVRDGAQVSANTSGEGKGGSLQVMASDSVEVIGRSAEADGEFGSNLFAITKGNGEAGNLTIETGRLLVRDGGQVATGTLSEGKGGSLQVTAFESVELIGYSANGRYPSGLFTGSEGNFDPNNPGNPQIPNGGDAGNIIIDTRRLIVRDGAQVISGTRTSGKGGTLQITASDSIELIGTSVDGQFSSGLFSANRGFDNLGNPIISNGGDAGNIIIDTGHLIVRDGAVASASTETLGQGGILHITASDSIELSGTSPDGQRPSGLITRSGDLRPNNSIVSGTGKAGDLIINTGQLLLHDGAELSSNSLGEGLAGNINITVRDTLQANNGTIRTDTTQSRGGTITITARDMRLFGDSDIRSNVASGADNGGNITLTANSILAFDDSDILAFARDGRGGDVTLNTPAFFGENYRPAPRNTNPDTFDNNNQVDINATGTVNGDITITSDTTFIQNSLTPLPDNQINTDSLLANSCIVRRNQPTRATFFITGTGGLPQRPGDAQMSTFPTVDIETLPSDGTPSTTNPNRPWQKGDPIVEPQGVYQLPNGKLVLSRECPE
ncbi:S-layer family protein [Geitlerinema splendidum]|nr:S-layer family protein [Geitlerinema splendidum]